MPMKYLCLNELNVTPHKALISVICLAPLLPVATTALALCLAYGFCPALLLVSAFAVPILLFWLFLLGVLRLRRHGRDLLQDYA